MTGAKPVTTPGLKEEVKADTEAERKVNLADANDPDCNECAEEPLRNDEIMSLHGWNINKYGMWEAEFEGATSMPLPPAGRMHRRITRDRDTLEFIEDLSVGATGLDRRADKAFKRPRNLTVEISIDNVEEETLSSSEQSLYRAVVARINYLAQDRGDLQYASKECSRKMSCPTKNDLFAVKKIARYLIHAPQAMIM